MKVLKALEKPLGNFSQALRKAVGKIPPTYSTVNLLTYGYLLTCLQPVKCDLNKKYEVQFSDRTEALGSKTKKAKEI